MVHKVAAHGNIILSLKLQRDELELEAKKTCSGLLAGWQDLDPAQIQVNCTDLKSDSCTDFYSF